jgi:hypothetical protein
MKSENSATKHEVIYLHIRYNQREWELIVKILVNWRFHHGDLAASKPKMEIQSETCGLHPDETGNHPIFEDKTLPAHEELIPANVGDSTT